MAVPYLIWGTEAVPLRSINILILFGVFGERGGTRTLDPMIKSHVLYRLSYALTCRAV